ncbi:hypothetical protein, partial [Kordiimonas lacus]|uniref:hypothetical protein n=1 Tax=Kordiimonas lacus TaxID=637679 RepID=UPI002FDAC6C2
MFTGLETTPITRPTPTGRTAQRDAPLGRLTPALSQQAGKRDQDLLFDIVDWKGDVDGGLVI